VIRDVEGTRVMRQAAGLLRDREGPGGLSEPDLAIWYRVLGAIDTGRAEIWTREESDAADGKHEGWIEALRRESCERKERGR
jgi:hypothetical protein